MPVYNSARYLRPAVDSILSQTFADFELVAVVDGSKDESARILESYDDPRLRIVRHETNGGVARRLQEGVAAARGEYLARMDADDISRPQRLARQVAFLDANPQIGMCGARARRFGADHRLMSGPTEPVDIRCELLFRSPFIHPSVMLRLEAFRSNDLNYRIARHCEDYELWHRAADCFPMANLPQVLLNYRVHPGSETGNAANANDLKAANRAIDLRALARLGFDPSEEELDLHAQLRSTSVMRLDRAEQWLSKLSEANRVVNLYPQEPFERAVARRWFHANYMAKGWGAYKWRRMKVSELSGGLRLSVVDVMKFAVRVR